MAWLYEVEDPQHEDYPRVMSWIDPAAWRWTDDQMLLKYDRARFKLLELKKKTGIKKRLYFHLFRHSSATSNAELGESMLRKIYGRQ